MKTHVWVAPPKGYGTPIDRRPLPVDERLGILRRLGRRDGWRCHWCGRGFRRTPARRCTIDHLVPVSVGGSWALSNLVLACRACNETRGDMPVDAWRSLIESRIQ